MKKLDWSAYKRKKNQVNNLIKKGKSEYNKQLLQENISKPETFWKCVKNLFPTKSKNKISSAKFSINGTETSNENDVANGFCSFFHSAVSKLKAGSIKLKNFVWAKPYGSRNQLRQSFSFPTCICSGS